MTHPAEGKLLPCPFCGAQPTTDRAGTPGKFGPIPTVRCTNEECFGPHTTAQFLADAVKQWNTRRSQGGKAEPAAWRVAGKVSAMTWRKEVAEQWVADGHQVQPLYTAPTPSPSGKAEPVAWRQSDEAVRNLIAREIWRYQECEEAYGPFDDNANESKQLDVGMRSLIKQTAIDQAELIRAVVLASPVVKAAIARLITDDDIYDIGKRDGYEDAVQDFDIATGGDGEFRGSTIPGRAVDVPAMKARVIARLSSPAESDVKPTDANISVLAEALYHCGCPAGGMTVGECAEQGVCGCSIRAERIKGCMGPDHQYFSREESQP